MEGSAGVDVIHAQQVLPFFTSEGDGTNVSAIYQREVFVVKGEAPYLIDFNRAIHTLDPPIYVDDRQMMVSYHLPSEDYTFGAFDTDGETVVLAQKLGVPAGNDKKWDIHELHYNPNTGTFEYGISAKGH